ncbi:MAG: hypothetical protein LBQ66_09675 [Planctomycetaceae bacterium]|nr:hypothetical protein [Planctomycetaceae bacterium]
MPSSPRGAEHAPVHQHSKRFGQFGDPSFPMRIRSVGIWCIGELMFFSAPFLAFALSGRELLGAIFHRALPCAMGFLPRWGVRGCAVICVIWIKSSW